MAMDAGVPIKAPVAGISIGMVSENDRYVLLTDIVGEEDFHGDMDFKVAWTANGVTGMQVDLKALSAAARRQRHGSVETATGESERAVRAAVYQRDGAGDTGVGHAHGFDRDAGRTAGRCDKAKLAGKGSEHRIAFGIDGKALV